MFIDIIEEGHRVQGVCNFRLIQGGGLTSETFRDFFHKLRRGDIVSKLACGLSHQCGAIGSDLLSRVERRATSNE